MTALLGPCRCLGCGGTVFWNGKAWRDAGQRSGRHGCGDDRPTCGVFMPSVRERCARRPGHRYEHRTRYALDNAARQKREGFAA